MFLALARRVLGLTDQADTVASASSQPAWIEAAAARRGPHADVSPELAMSLSTVYRCVQLHVTAARQLPIDVHRGDQALPAPLIITSPSTGWTRRTFIEHTILSLYLDGSAFWRRIPVPGRPGDTAELIPLHPGEVQVTTRKRDSGRDERRYLYRGTRYSADEIVQLDLLRLPGAERGLSPLGAARVTLQGALAARDYGMQWLDTSATPDGILSTDQVLSPDEAHQYREAWYGRRPDGTPMAERRPGERLRVLGKGLSYEHLTLKPSDVQFLETQSFTAVELCRLFGVAPDLAGVAMEGGGRTYSNVEQSWIEYTRFGLMLALSIVEDALSSCLPRGQEARFRIDALARADRLTRLQGHKLMLDAGIATKPEVRAWEGLPPIGDPQ